MNWIHFGKEDENEAAEEEDEKEDPQMNNDNHTVKQCFVADLPRMNPVLWGEHCFDKLI